MKAGRKKKNTQFKARKKVFSTVQPWIIYFTERYSDSSEKDFFTFIKARSFASAKDILSEKTKEDDSSVKLKAIQGFLLHKDYQNTKICSKLDTEGWLMVHDASFPNVNNFLFKQETPRPEGYSNRFNKTNHEHLKTIGFKKGADNWSKKHRKGTHLPLDQRQGKKWVGDKWVKIDDIELKKIKGQLISSFIKNNNNRCHVAKDLGISRHKLYKLMKTVNTLDWWTEYYPAPKPAIPRVSKEQRSAKQKEVMGEMMKNGFKPFDFDDDMKALATKNRVSTLKKKSEDYRVSLIPKIREGFIKYGNSRTEVAKQMGIPLSTFKNWLKNTKKYVNWSEEFPYSRKK
jgi:DNA invertase Pin-like site-specific DNA recombinase|tara:strand:+ start:30365 stop:31396 length:1032 start_codon:yes stop_codon:yes gene_type:complete